MRKKLILLLTLLMMALIIPVTAQAQGLKTPQFKLYDETDTSVKVSITKVYGAKGYGIFRKVNGKWKKVAYTTKTSYTVKNLKPSTKYTFTVKAYQVVGGKKKFSPNFKKSGRKIKTWDAGHTESTKPGSYLREDGEYRLEVLTVEEDDALDFKIGFGEPGLGFLVMGTLKMGRGFCSAFSRDFSISFYKTGLLVKSTDESMKDYSGFYRTENG